MLLDNFYTIKEINSSDKENSKVEIELNKTHEIYQGHFPDNPVVPGVCLTQIIHELVETIVKKELHLSYASNIKFMAIVNPEINNILQIDLKIKYDNTENLLKVESVTHAHNKVFYKFKGNFIAK
ncbi:MAG: hydroxymyristoyl-ACP dehydratase [Bacteroidales bacterium]|jgi:3-hydroxyacyl-[acyl-carrier-protein] dehydratase|nr:hydroxymyristoyl-ACP dehydratase [Bacteroidales bacterium]